MKKRLMILTLSGFLLLGCTQVISNSSSSEEPVEPSYYTITWVNDDGTILETDHDVIEGSVPKFDQELPTKDNKNGYSYVFKCWEPALKVVTSNQTYTATYDRVSYYYTINFDLDGGYSLSCQPIRYAQAFSKDLFSFDVKKDGYYFRGWKTGDVQIFNEYGDQLVESITITDNMTFKAVYTDNPVDYNGEPVINTAASTVSYGLFPQNLLQDEDVINDLNKYGEELYDNKGHYIYKHEYYKKLVATPFGVHTKFCNGEPVVYGKTYWFKYEPVTWKIMTDYKNGSYLLATEKVLTKHQFMWSRSERKINGKTIYSNNYEYSEIRTWLNNDFYKELFILDDSRIAVTKVDNSLASVYSPSAEKPNAYVCNNTSDKVFLNSFKECNDLITAKGDCRCMATDYVRAEGLSISDDGYVEYLLRSPSSADGASIHVVDVFNVITTSVYVDSYQGVRPLITFKSN